MSALKKFTPYITVNLVLGDLLKKVSTLLNGNFIGMYLYGSLALNDFCSSTSDIDVLVVTARGISNQEFKFLKGFHEQFNASDSEWAGRLEVAYIPKTAFLNFKTNRKLKYPQIEKQTTLIKEVLEIGWPFQCRTLHEHGVTIAGPNPLTFIPLVDQATMYQAALSIAEMWRAKTKDQDWLKWVEKTKEQSFVILTLCRILYTVNTNSIASKPAAAEWAQEILPKKWSDLIKLSLIRSGNQSLVPGEEVIATIDFINYTVESLQYIYKNRLSVGKCTWPHG